MPDAPAPPANKGPRHLIVRLRNWVGDTVLSLAALNALDQAGYSLTLVARGGWAPDLLRGTRWPILVQPKGLWARAAQLHALRQTLSLTDPGFGQRLNTLVLPQSFSSALETRLAGLHSLGYRHEGRNLLLTHSLPMPSAGHVASHYLQLSLHLIALLTPSSHQPSPAPEAPAPMLPVPPSATVAAQLLLRQHQVNSRYMVVCPFAGGKSPNAGLDKSWPCFSEFVNLAAQALDIPMLICPGTGEVEWAQKNYPAALCLKECGLDIYTALLQTAALVVAIDTGPGHMAAAVGAPLLSLMGPSSAAHWRPLGPGVELLVGYPEWPTAQHVLARCQARLGTLPIKIDK